MHVHRVRKDGRAGPRRESSPGAPGNPSNASGTPLDGGRAGDDARANDDVRAERDGGNDTGGGNGGRGGGRNGGRDGASAGAGRGGGGRAGSNGRGGNAPRPHGALSSQEHATRRKEAAELKRARALATEKASAEKLAAKKLRIDTDETARVRNLAIVAAREGAVPLDDSTRPSFRSHADRNIPRPSSPDVADQEAADKLRALCDAKLSVPVRFNALGNVLPAHRIWSAYYLAHRGDDGAILSFGTRRSFVSLLHAAAAVAGHGEDTGIWDHVLVPNVFPGGYTVVLFDATVEGKLRDAIAELGRGREEFLFSPTLPDSVPADDIALLAWRLDAVIASIEASAGNTVRTDMRDARRARAVALRLYANLLSSLPDVADALAAASATRDAADAASIAAQEALDKAAAAEASAAADAAGAAAEADSSPPPLGPPTPSSPDADQHTASPDPTPAEALAATAAAATAAADAAATAEAIRSTQLPLAVPDADNSDVLAPVPARYPNVHCLTTDALAEVSQAPLPVPAEAPDFLLFQPASPAYLPPPDSDLLDQQAGYFLSTPEGQHWLRNPTPHADRQSSEWLCCSAQGGRWLAQDGSAWLAESPHAAWYRCRPCPPSRHDARHPRRRRCPPACLCPT